MAAPLHLGPIAVEGFTIGRSGLRWLCDDGHICQPGETIAYCNISFQQIAVAPPAPLLFPEEMRDFQLALSTPVGGRLRHRPESSRGGLFDQLDVFVWDPDFVIGHLELPDGGKEAIPLQPLILAGRRATEVAEVRSGLLSGWHDRTRAWRAEGEGAVGTLLCLGICDLEGVIRGDRGAFLEMFETIEGPAQVVYVPDPPLVPNSRFLAEQITRTTEQFEEISRDLAQALATGPELASPQDWILAAAMLRRLQVSPITDRYPILTRSGLRQAGPADAIILSLNAESKTLLRHRKLGYTLWLHHFRLNDAGRAVHDWFNANFELVPRSLGDIQRDYRNLIDLIHTHAPGAQILICNKMSTDGAEDVQCYSAFDPPLGNTLASVEAKDLNLMLYDLARERDIAVVDTDAIVAKLGARANLQAGVHQSGEMQAAQRSEILQILRQRGVPGFGRRAS